MRRKRYGRRTGSSAYVRDPDDAQAAVKLIEGLRQCRGRVEIPEGSSALALFSADVEEFRAHMWRRIGHVDLTVETRQARGRGFWGESVWEFSALRDIFTDQFGVVVVPHSGVTARFVLAQPLQLMALLRCVAFGDPVVLHVAERVPLPQPKFTEVSVCLN